jgi:hypothetical protein
VYSYLCCFGHEIVIKVQVSAIDLQLYKTGSK